MNDPGAKQPSQMFLIWVKARPQHRELRDLLFPPFYFHFCFLMQKPLRIERQKGKAALGKLKLIEDLPKERCCVDNCVMVSVTSKL